MRKCFCKIQIEHFEIIKTQISTVTILEMAATKSAMNAIQSMQFLRFAVQPMNGKSSILSQQKSGRVLLGDSDHRHTVMFINNVDSRRLRFLNDQNSHYSQMVAIGLLDRVLVLQTGHSLPINSLIYQKSRENVR